MNTSLRTLAALAFTMQAALATAGSTSTLGGSGGTNDYSLGCSANQRVTGIGARHGDVIARVRIRCTTIQSDGSWGGTSSWSSYTASDAPQSAPNTNQASCGSNTYVRSFRVYSKQITTGQTVIARIEVACHASDATLGASGNSVTTPTVGSSSGGSWSSWAACPDNGLTRSINGRRGWYVDNMRLNCTDPVPPQAPTAAPTLVLPRWVGSSASDSYGATPSWAVRLQPVANATHYNICVRDAGATSCYLNQTPAAVALSGGSMPFAITIPASKQGTLSEWTARGCNGTSNCGPWASAERFTVVPNAPNLSAPANAASLNSRNVTFQWQAATGANAGYQLIIWKIPGSNGYDVYNPAASLPSGNLSLQVAAGSTSRTVDVPATLGATVSWAVVACAEFAGKGRRCSLGYEPRSLTLPTTTTAPTLSFALHLYPIISSPDCSSCHPGTTLYPQRTGPSDNPSSSMNEMTVSIPFSTTDGATTMRNKFLGLVARSTQGAYAQALGKIYVVPGNASLSGLHWKAQQSTAPAFGSNRTILGQTKPLREWIQIWIQQGAAP
jgi:hypothetical protein